MVSTAGSYRVILFGERNTKYCQYLQGENEQLAVG